MKIAELDPDPRASISLSGGPLPSQKHGRRWDEVSPLATEALPGPWRRARWPLTSLPNMHISHLKMGCRATPGRKLSTAYSHAFFQGVTYLAVLGDQLGQWDLEMGLGKKRFYHTSRGRVLERTEEKTGAWVH